jgi:putative colanic acid biosynthesis acetyltransferase WcaF
MDEEKFFHKMKTMLERYEPSRSNRDFFSLKTRLRSEIWGWLNLSLYRMLPRQCRWWRRLLLRMFGGQVGHTSALGRLVKIDRPWNFEIGERSSIADDAWVYCLDRITIGDKVCIGSGVKLISGTHDINSPHFQLVTKPIVIHSGVWIANCATILPGVIVGEGAVVGACAVVSKDVEPWTVVAGNPAKYIKKRDIRECEQVRER